MQMFREVIDECNFMDLGFVSSNFTWSKHFEDGRSIWERLDRGLATNSWFHCFLGTRVFHLLCLSSDHCPLLISPTSLDLPPQKKVFRFEEMWLSDNGCREIVEAVWNSCVT